MCFTWCTKCIVILFISLSRIHCRTAVGQKQAVSEVTYFCAELGVKYLLNQEFTAALFYGGSVAQGLACWTQAQKGPGSNCSRDAAG